MDRSGSQKALQIISIINIVLGALALLAGIVSVIAAISTANISSADLAQAGLDAETQATAGAALIVVAVFALITGAISLIEGILGLRAAKDNQKIMPVWILSIIGLASAVINIVMSITQGAFGLGTLSGLVGPGLMFWIANNIKNEAGR